MKNYFILTSLILTLALFSSCSKDDDMPLKVTTSDATDITSSSATLNGEVVEGSTEGLVKGFVYGRFENPDLTDNVVNVSGSELGVYSYELTGLPNNAQYYVRAYAINLTDTAFGSEIDFKTNL